jgi:hypothetical protein
VVLLAAFAYLRTDGSHASERAVGVADCACDRIGSEDGALDYNETEAAARLLRLQLQTVEVPRTVGLDRAFSAVAKGRAEALIVAWPNAKFLEKLTDGYYPYPPALDSG